MIRFIFSIQCKKLRAAIWRENLLINDLNVQEAILQDHKRFKLNIQMNINVTIDYKEVRLLLTKQFEYSLNATIQCSFSANAPIVQKRKMYQMNVFLFSASIDANDVLLPRQQQPKQCLKSALRPAWTKALVFILFVLSMCRGIIEAILDYGIYLYRA